MQSKIWGSTIALHITHSSSPIPYILSVPRLSYLPLLLPRLSTFFGLPSSSFSYQGILLKNLPVGLLFDLYQPELPWRLDLGDGPLFDIHDTFVNSVKEADFIRNGTARGVMSMSKEQSLQMWNSVQDNDFALFNKINTLLLNPATPLRHIPLRVYIPSSPSASATLGSFKIVQSLIPPLTAKREVQTLGSALNKILPSLFPSRRDAILAEPILHGAPVPFKAPLEELMREAAYADGWLHVCVEMLN
ncbi:autophagy protein 5 [Coleophoma crateriformis]|uniref:Autophagy protein 5 n=1 Tax=Coleophoma crateriformis TaxID=565419 RepID=A0A3D8T1L6_9HELO|nr:autophagy protein 5 [Coleophoma crateriformis]